MIDYRKIWESINNESKSNPLKSPIARRIPSSGLLTVFLATDLQRGIRLLYIKVDNEFEVDIDQLPRFKGLEISRVLGSLGEFHEQDFIKLRQTIPNVDNIFELVISDVCDRITQLISKKNFGPLLIKILNEWKLFFEKEENEILSIEAQKGLFGELYFLKNYLFKKYSLNESLVYWTGYDRTNHDFQIRNIAVEVKTTSSKQHLKFMISSEKQLDNTGLDNLYLLLFTLNLHSNMPERTLPAFIDEIYGCMSGDPGAMFYLQIKLLKYGYNQLDKEKYKLGFSLNTMRYFEVREGFPRILQNTLPEGVGDLKYSVVVSACGSFEISTNILNYI